MKIIKIQGFTKSQALHKLPTGRQNEATYKYQRTQFRHSGKTP